MSTILFMELIPHIFSLLDIHFGDFSIFISSTRCAIYLGQSSLSETVTLTPFPAPALTAVKS